MAAILSKSFFFLFPLHEFCMNSSYFLRKLLFAFSHQVAQSLTDDNASSLISKRKV